jgi:hypothetical protein
LKNFLAYFISVCVLNSNIYAQTDFLKNSIGLEFVGDHFLYSIIYSRHIYGPFSFKIGSSFSPSYIRNNLYQAPFQLTKNLDSLQTIEENIWVLTKSVSASIYHQHKKFFFNLGCTFLSNNQNFITINREWRTSNRDYFIVYTQDVYYWSFNIGGSYIKNLKNNKTIYFGLNLTTIFLSDQNLNTSYPFEIYPWPRLGLNYKF